MMMSSLLLKYQYKAPLLRPRFLNDILHVRIMKSHTRKNPFGCIQDLAFTGFAYVRFRAHFLFSPSFSFPNLSYSRSAANLGPSHCDMTLENSLARRFASSSCNSSLDCRLHLFGRIPRFWYADREPFAGQAGQIGRLLRLHPDPNHRLTCVGRSHHRPDAAVDQGKIGQAD